MSMAAPFALIWSDRKAQMDIWQSCVLLALGTGGVALGRDGNSPLELRQIALVRDEKVVKHSARLRKIVHQWIVGDGLECQTSITLQSRNRDYFLVPDVWLECAQHTRWHVADGERLSARRADLRERFDYGSPWQGVDLARIGQVDNRAD